MYKPNYRQNIFSVQAAIGRASAVNLTPNFVELSTADETRFAIILRNMASYIMSSTQSLVVKHTLLRYGTK